MPSAFNTPNIRIARSGDIPVWDAKINQWIPKTAPRVSLNGTLVPAPVTQGQASIVVSTGAFGVYTINFPAAFATAPVVVASIGNIAGNIGIINVTAVNTTSFTFSMGMFTPGLVAPTAAANVLVEWIAVGT